MGKSKHKPVLLIVGFIALIIGLFTPCSILSINRKSLFAHIPNIGKVQGSIGYTSWTHREFYQFLSIPYAESPKCSLRFQPPVPRKSWFIIHDGTKFGQPCPGLLSTLKNDSTKDVEDCLSISVYTLDVDQKNPVMFYIHGGGFNNGSAEYYPPNFLLEKDIVLVVAQYRLGPLGWLSTRTKEIPGNMAIMDIHLALQWVKKYISNFGGDPYAVTIFGQSAGTAIIGLLTMSPKIESGLFQRAIVSSGSIFSPWAVNQKPIDTARSICDKLGCPICHEQVHLLNECFLKASVQSLLNATSALHFSPSSGDYYEYLQDHPFKSTQSNRYPTMAGVTKHEGTFFFALIYDMINEQYNGDFKGLTVSNLIDHIFKLYENLYSEKENQIVKQLAMSLIFQDATLNSTDLKAFIPHIIDFCGLLFMKSPVLTYVEVSQNMDRFLYSFDYEGEHTKFGYGFGNSWYPFHGGVHHSNDLFYLFPMSRLNANDTEVAQLMVDIWTSFARTGIPEGNGVRLPKFGSGYGPYIKISRNVEISQSFLNEFTTFMDSQKLIRPHVNFGK